MLAHWHPLIARTRALADDNGISAAIQLRAAAARDLLDLVTYWPLPRASRFRADLGAALFDLCHHAGVAICGGGYCPHEGGADAVCRVVAWHEAWSDSVCRLPRAHCKCIGALCSASLRESCATAEHMVA